MRPRSQRLPLLAVLLLLVSACAQATASPTPPEARVAAAHNDTSTPFNLVSLPALVRHRYDGRGLRLDRVVDRGLAATRYHLTYRSGDLSVSGQLSVPNRRGRLPLVVLAHGYEDPARYRSGAALAREAAHLAARGYVVMLTDYRNHGDSDREGARTVRRPLGYPEDVVNAILAVRRARLSFVDPTRTAVLGRSMGGGAALAAVAARPGLVDALVLYSPVSSSAVDSYRRWVVDRPALRRRVVSAYGAPSTSPRFWRDASSRGYLRRVDVPVQLHHGTADRICPVSWSRATVAALVRAGQRVDYHEYPGEGHRLDEAWPTMAGRVVAFLDRHLR